MIETKIDGNPSSVRATATWLRSSLAPGVDKSGDAQDKARSKARGAWEGEAASAYQKVTRKVVYATDQHGPRVRRAADACDDYASKLESAQKKMKGLRRRARNGGLEVTGTVIVAPPDVPHSVVVPGSPEEAARNKAIEKVELYNTLSQECSTEHEKFTVWVDSSMPNDVEDAREKNAIDWIFKEVTSVLPGLLLGAGAGYTGLALQKLAEKYKADAREFRRKSRVSGDPRVRGQAGTKKGKAHLDDLLKKSTKLTKWGGKLLGPFGIALDIGLGIYEGTQTGDWTRVALTVGTSIAVGAGITAAVAAGIVTAPAWVVIGGGALLAAGASWGVGKIYDNWDNITDWTGNRWDDAKDIASDGWEGAKDLAGGAWDAVTSW